MRSDLSKFKRIDELIQATVNNVVKVNHQVGAVPRVAWLKKVACPTIEEGMAAKPTVCKKKCQQAFPSETCGAYTPLQG